MKRRTRAAVASGCVTALACLGAFACSGTDVRRTHERVVGANTSTRATETPSTNHDANDVSEGPADLPGATPTDPPSNHADTGSPARVVLGARRERAADLFSRFLRAMARRDLPAISAMMNTSVYDLDRGETYPREQLLGDLETILSRIDPSALGAVANARVLVRSAAEMRRIGRSIRVQTERDDWFVETLGRPGATSQAGMLVPRLFMVRFVGDEPLVGGLTIPLRNRF